MNEPEVRRHDDADVLVGDIASALLARLEAAQARGEVPQVGLTGGTIAEELHRELARRAVDSAVDWSRVVFWWGDERFVPADSPDRNARQARESLLDHFSGPLLPEQYQDHGRLVEAIRAGDGARAAYEAGSYTAACAPWPNPSGPPAGGPAPGGEGAPVPGA